MSQNAPVGPLNDAARGHYFADQDAAYAIHEAPARHKPTPHKKHAKHDMMSFTGVQTNPTVPTFMRTNRRWDYVREYFDFWKGEKISTIQFVFWLAAGLFTLNVFPPGALLMIAMAARFKSLQYWNKFVYREFGLNRTLITID